MASTQAISHNLKERFQAAEHWYLEKGEFVELNSRDEKAIDTFEHLVDTVDAVPATLLQETVTLIDAVGDKQAEQLLDQMIPYIGQSVFPAAASDFVKALNGHLARIAQT